MRPDSSVVLAAVTARRAKPTRGPEIRTPDVSCARWWKCSRRTRDAWTTRAAARAAWFARHKRDALPNASFVDFTGTPIDQPDANARAVFGDYISVYDIQRAVADGATVPIYYEGRLAKLKLKDAERPKIDPQFEEATEGEEVDRKEKLNSRWTQLEAVVGSEHRIKLVARDLVDHFESRLAMMDGKAMIVAASRRIAVELYGDL